MRTGDDTLAVSALDLLERRLTWKPFYTRRSDWRMKNFALKCAYDYDDSRFKRTISIKPGETAVPLSARDLGIVGLVEESQAARAR